MKVFELLFSVALTGFGAYGLAFQLRDLLHSLASRRWFKGQAIVTEATVCERRGARGRIVFEPTILYRYTYNQREYIGHRLAFADVSSASQADAAAVVQRFAVGSEWEVAVCESQPQLAVIHPGPTQRLWFSLTFFTVYFIAAVSFLVDALRRI